MHDLVNILNLLTPVEEIGLHQAFLRVFREKCAFTLLLF